LQVPSLANPKSVQDLPQRGSPYWNILEYCRHIGIEKAQPEHWFWLARIRTKNGQYRQSRLSIVQNSDGTEVSYSAAVRLAWAWFESPAVRDVASASYPVGTNRQLKYAKTQVGFTIGDAMHDYVEWKRLAATRSHFETNLSLINHHIMPRLAHLPVADFTNRNFVWFCRDVLETLPKRGNREVLPKVSLDTLDAEALRKRKKTVNALIGILRLALRLAWENGETDSDRAWRCLRRLPNRDMPRHLFLSRDQCRILIQHCRDDLADLVRAALYSGCRISELANLRVCDVGGDIFGIYISSSKNRHRRCVYLPDEGMNFFLRKCADKDRDDLLFRTQTGQSWRGYHKHLFKESVRHAGLPDRFVFHGLRHTYASQLVQAGTPLAVVAQQLGHSNTDTVSRTYGHLSSATIEAELSSRFSALEPANEDNLIDIRGLRDSLQDGPHLPNDESAWPRKNFSLAAGPLLQLVKADED